MVRCLHHRGLLNLLAPMATYPVSSLASPSPSAFARATRPRPSHPSSRARRSSPSEAIRRNVIYFIRSDLPADDDPVSSPCGPLCTRGGEHVPRLNADAHASNAGVLRTSLTARVVFAAQRRGILSQQSTWEPGQMRPTKIPSADVAQDEMRKMLTCGPM